jgi:hypothetical protein
MIQVFLYKLGPEIVLLIALGETSTLSQDPGSNPCERLHAAVLIIRCIVVLYLKDTCDRCSFYNYLVFPRVI